MADHPVVVAVGVEVVAEEQGKTEPEGVYYTLFSMSQLTPRAQLERNITLFPWANFFSGLIFIIPIWILFERQFLTIWQMALLESVATALTLVLELPTGALADLIGRKTTASLGWTLQGIGTLIEGVSHEPVLFITGFAIMAVGLALVSGADSALLYDSLKELGRPQDFKKEMSRSGLFMQFSLALSTLTGGFLYQYWVGLPYLGYGLGMLLAGWLFWQMREPNIDSETFSWSNYRKQLTEGWKEVWHSQWSRWVGLFFIVVGGITWSGQLFFNNNFLVELGFTPLELGFLLGAIRILNSIVLFLLLRSEQILTPQRIFVFFPVLMLLAYIPGFWVSGWAVFPFMMAASMSSTARHILLGQLCNDVYTSKNRATALSTLNMAVSLWYCAAMLVGGWVIELSSARLAYAGMSFLTLLFVVPVALKLLTLPQQHAKH